MVTRLGTLLVSGRAGTPTQVYLTLKTLLLATMLRYITLFYKRKKMKPESLSGLPKDTKQASNRKGPNLGLLTLSLVFTPLFTSQPLVLHCGTLWSPYTWNATDQVNMPSISKVRV